MTARTVSRHCSGKQHLKKVAVVRAAQERIRESIATEAPTNLRIAELEDQVAHVQRPFQQAEGVKVRIDSLGLAAWHHHVQALLFSYVDSAARPTSTRASRQAEMKELEDLLVRYETREGLSLRELAAWKAVCVVQIPDSILGYHEYSSWASS